MKPRDPHKLVVPVPRPAAEAEVAWPLNWFRGLDLHASLIDTLLAAHVEVGMQMPEKK